MMLMWVFLGVLYFSSFNISRFIVSVELGV